MSNSSSTSGPDTSKPTLAARRSSPTPRQTGPKGANPSNWLEDAVGNWPTRSSTPAERPDIDTKTRHELSLLFDADSPHPCGYICSCGEQDSWDV